MNSRKILEKKQYPHKADNKLFLVLCEFGDEFVTWEYNSEFNGYGHGHYFVTLEKAKEDFDERWEKLNS